MLCLLLLLLFSTFQNGLDIFRKHKFSGVLVVTAGFLAKKLVMLAHGELWGTQLTQILIKTTKHQHKSS